jgi:hypothetical protein
VVERSERYAREAKPEEPQDFKRRAWAVLVMCCTNRSTFDQSHAERPEGEAWIWNTILLHAVFYKSIFPFS